jgi:hypothetical protein
MPLSLAYFITPHGFGHAARAATVMNAIQARRTEVTFHLFTQVPGWLFRDSLTARYVYHAEWTDVGVAQKDPLHEDLPETVRQLGEFYPPDAGRVARLAEMIVGSGCRAVLCDIAPLGLAVARQAGLPGILIENFTWDWIYEGYLDREPRLEPFFPALRELTELADLHIQTRPACDPNPAYTMVNVTARSPRMSRSAVRDALGVRADEPLAMVTMGGIAQQYAFLERLKGEPGVRFVVPAAAETLVHDANLILMPHHTPIFHPDLVFASDAVIGKVGYSTLGEVYRAGVPFAYVPREKFREMPPLVDFIQANIPGFEVRAGEFLAGTWVGRARELVGMPKVTRAEVNGADQIARLALDAIR